MYSSIISVREVYKSYSLDKQTLPVLRGITMDVPPAQLSLIVGASGAGKSTLLHILCGLDRPDYGKVFVDGSSIEKLSDKSLSAFRSAKTGLVFQFHHLLPEFTAEENVAIPLMIAGKSKSAALKRAKKVLEIVQLAERGHHKPAELSGGEQQRVAIARALANDPDIIFADEPTGNLDSVSSDAIHQLFLHLRDTMKKTFVIVTHNPALMELADNIFRIKDGKIVNGTEGNIP